MKILIVDTYYEFFLKEFYAKKRGELAGLTYEAHRDRLMKHRFSSSDAFSFFFRKEGWEAEEIVFNDNELQAKWAAENGILALRLPSLAAKGFNVLFGIDWRFDVLREQIKRLRPEVVLIKEQSLLTDAMVKEIRSMVKFVAITIGSRFLQRRRYSDIDLAFTCVPHFIPLLEARGMKACYLKMAFDPRVLGEIEKRPKSDEVSFVGGVTVKHHRLRNEILERLSRDFPFRWYGYSTNPRDQSGELKKVWAGPVWGLEMYQALADSWTTVNIHGEIAAANASNVRLFEATGIGTCLVTDWKENIARELFVPDEEVVTYRTADELAEKVRYLLGHKDVCEEISKAGQARTLRDHTYENRVKEMIPHIRKLLP